MKQRQESVRPAAMNFYLGCAVWSYVGWLGNFYPAKSRLSDCLKLYGQRLWAVEGNTTFYAVPNSQTIARWKTEVPDGFQFCLKFPKTITHHGVLQPLIPDALQFLERISALRDRLGPTFIQLPPSYGPEHLADLQAFLTALPCAHHQIAVEVRHLDWFMPSQARLLNDLLASQQVGRVLLDTRPIYQCPDNPQAQSQRRKPKLPLHPLLTSDFALIRFISHPQTEWNQNYLTQWVEQVAQWLAQGKTIYYFVHCPIEERSPYTARSFQALLEQAGVPIPPLPWQHLAPEPQQLSLF